MVKFLSLNSLCLPSRCLVSPYSHYFVNLMRFQQNVSVYSCWMSHVARRRNNRAAKTNQSNPNGSRNGSDASSGRIRQTCGNQQTADCRKHLSALGLVADLLYCGISWPKIRYWKIHVKFKCEAKWRTINYMKSNANFSELSYAKWMLYVFISQFYWLYYYGSENCSFLTSILRYSCVK